MHESYKARMYKCTQGYNTVGYGFNMDALAMPKEVAELWLSIEIEQCEKDCKKLFGEHWAEFSEPRQAVFVDMRFNLGSSGFRLFRCMRRAAKAGKWGRVALEMQYVRGSLGDQENKWYQQTGSRAKKLIKMILNDRWYYVDNRL